VTKSSFFRIKLQKKERKHSVCKWWPCNSHREHLEIQFDYGRNSFDKGILEKLTKEGKNLAFYTAANKLKP